jgi:uncharacterized protein
MSQISEVQESPAFNGRRSFLTLRHTHERTHPNVTIQTCLDSVRLDLGRVGIMPHPSRLCTEVAKRSKTIKWADGRAAFRVVPNFVLDEWGIDLENEPRW